MNRNSPTQIHETVLKDIIDIFDDIKNLDVDKIIAAKKNKPMAGMSSIAKASSNLVLVFPVICSRAISIESASMISKALEKNAVTMLQRLFAAYQVANGDDVHSVQDFLNQFHSNISSSVASLDDLFRVVDNIGESGNISPEVIKAIKEDTIRNLNYYLPTSINETSLNDYSVKNGVVTEGGVIDYDKENLDLARQKLTNDSKNADRTANIALQNLELNKNKADAEKARNTQIDAEDRRKNRAKENLDTFKSDIEFLQHQVLDGDYKKANELMPTQLIINFKVKEGDNVYTYTTAVCGVKAKLYPIGSEDILKHISEKNADRNWLTNFFRATTREISFIKDFVLAIDKAKIDAMSLSTRKSTTDKMWKVLERRALSSKLKKALHSSNNSSAAITTLCVSQEEVEYLRKHYNVDLERVSTILGLFESLNLMCVVIVDESLEVAKFIYDEQEPMWETISFTHLERESSDNTYKRVVNLMTKVAR